MDKSKFNDKKEWRKFAYGLSAIFFIIASIQLFLGKALFPYFYGACLLFLITGLIAPVLIKPIFILFSYIGYGIGWFMTRMILSILFYFVFTTIGFIARLFGKHFIDLKFDREPTSYWIQKEQDSIHNYEKMF